ncbi:PREDICTED: flexible cuticle protein 12-like [Papilio polytes]|uniref:flexible cuticle protein 12-like n=1 Tax=Papilio polytes TaxID=76194 RepID=UPI0006766314|nr:PREDICTED: flexible cuticle protein 12-like [Papilio polytes]
MLMVHSAQSSCVFSFIFLNKILYFFVNLTHNAVNMYQVVLVLALVVYSIEAKNLLDKEANIEDYKNENDGLGNYFFRFVTSNGITREETGRLVNSGQSDEHIAVEGFYTYSDNDGILRTVNYKADSNGYVIISPALPQLPAAPVPASVVASLLGK